MTEEIAPRPIKRILVANRGEIATRILTTCRELDLETVALYTDNDVAHTFGAAHACHLPSAAAYMDVDVLCRLAREHRVDAVHPGYGFLSESPLFAARMAAQNVLVVGPGATNLARTGDKLSARRLAEECGVPALSALTTPTGEVAEVRRFAETNGLPIMVKAVDGGGGRGIRLIRRMEDVAGLATRAIEESPSKQVFAEKAAVDGFRHVEVQIVGDGKGNVMHLWERECSIQRRYQKVVELAPSMAKDRSIVAPVIDAAVRMARKINYASLGTFEFLLNPETREFFFLEINPRLQVEHTITESICSTDIVKAQLRLAQGASFADAGLSHLSQDPTQPPPHHAIQLRLTAEDPEKNHSLSIGRVRAFHFPSGAGIRVDTAFHPAAPAFVTADFDSVIAKIIVTARTWPDAVAKAARALADTRVDGVRTNLALLRAVVAHPAFAAGTCDTQWLEAQHADLLARSRRYAEAGRTSDPFHGLVKPDAGVGDAMPSEGNGGAGAGGPLLRKDDAWTVTLQPRSNANGGEKGRKEGAGGSGGQEKEEDGETSPHHLQLTRILLNDFPTTFAADILYTRSAATHPEAYTLKLASTTASGAATTSAAARRQGQRSDPSHVILPLSGKLVEVLVDVGDRVGKDEPICVVRQMKMEVEVRSHRAGQVSWVTEAEDGEDVAEGMLAAVVEEEADEETAKAKL